MSAGGGDKSNEAPAGPLAAKEVVNNSLSMKKSSKRGNKYLLSDYTLVVLAWHGSQVAMVCPLPVLGDLQIGH